MSGAANFAAFPRSEICSISIANGNRDGIGTIVSAFTTGASGSRIERIEIKAVGTTTAGMVRAFKKQGADPWKLWREYAIAAIVPSASQPTAGALDDEIGEVLKTGVQIGFATHNAEAFEVSINGGDF